MNPITDASCVFTVSVPDGWAVASNEGGHVCATPPGQQANVLIIAQPRQAESLDTLAETTCDALRRSMPNWAETDRWPIQVSGRPALHIRARSASVGIPMIGEYVLTLTERHEVMASANYAASDASMRVVAAEILGSLELASD